VISLDKSDVLNNILIALGERHKDYGSKIEHLPVKKSLNLNRIEFK
jgi:hypothetical protein